jgi:hypothetical protein
MPKMSEAVASLLPVSWQCCYTAFGIWMTLKPPRSVSEMQSSRLNDGEGLWARALRCRFGCQKELRAF